MEQTTKKKGGSIISAILQLSGIITFGVGIIASLNTIFNWNIGLRVSGARIEVPSDWESSIAFFVFGVLLFGFGWILGLGKVRTLFKKHKWLVFVILALSGLGGFFGLNSLNVMSMGGPALAAAQQNKPDALKKLYADNKINVEETELLARALYYESKDVILYLIEKGVNTNANFTEGMPMIFRALLTDTDIIMAFLNAGTDLSVKNSEGETVLIALAGSYAISQEDAVKIAGIMLNRKVDKNARNKEGKTAAEVAENRGYSELAELLK